MFQVYSQVSQITQDAGSSESASVHGPDPAARSGGIRCRHAARRRDQLAGAVLDALGAGGWSSTPAGALRAALSSSLTCLLTSALRHACANDTIHRDAFRHASRFSRTALQSSFSSAQAMLPCSTARAKGYIFGLACCAHMHVCLMCPGRCGWPIDQTRQPGSRGTSANRWCER